jgi:hypothetical protein
MRIRLWRKPPLPNERRQVLERWVRSRLQMLKEEPLMAIFGAFGRLTAEGMDRAEAFDTIMRIVREEEAAARQ